MRLTIWQNPLPHLIGLLPFFHRMPEAFVMVFVIAVVLVGFAAAGIGMRLIAAPAIVWSLRSGRHASCRLLSPRLRWRVAFISTTFF